jgi:hypothetical protein
MELVAVIIYQIASHSFSALFVSIAASIGSFSLTTIFFSSLALARSLDTEAGPSVRGRILRIILPWGSLLIFLFCVAFALFAVINIIRPHVIDGYIIDSVGEKADARVISIEETNNRHNKRAVMRHNIVFKTADGTNVETYFDTWDFNIYPTANSVRYPQTGETFKVAYLPSFPDAFLILTEAESDYSENKKCRDLLTELDHRRKLAEFDPEDVGYQEQLNEARSKAESANCIGKKPAREKRDAGMTR